MASPSPLSGSQEKHRQPLTHDDYIDSRHLQDQQLNVEFTSVRCSIDRVWQELKTDIDLVRQELKTDIGLVKQDLQEFKEDVKAQNQRLETQIRQSHAYMRNNALKNPTLPIRPVV
ncbi:hypothetical protein LZ30DRAFT_538987, partial [Colletotrichum cereale]